LIAYIRRPL